MICQTSLSTAHYVGRFEFALKGRGFSRAVSSVKSTAALAAGGMCLSN